ncbi:MFS transporter [Marinilongibacter aquaticus]|uniref:MFS transporter n=1 Tax=Marinilongibacter aquaticus TaxID=2975157 RepID=UPI0021BD7C1B|nr:MFS transporter [Marinilongibacter aquaticus]UBM58506.1 MFS transporter [Marinilongibacter aquaticus]
MSFPKNQKKVINAWCMYDWANSVHNLVITSVIFPIYFHATAVGSDGSDVIDFLGFRINNDVLYSYTLSVSTLILVLLSPVLTGVADNSGRRKFFLKLFCYLGAASCVYFYFFTKNNIVSSVVAFGLSMIGWGGSVVFYNSYLPDIASEDRFDRISARGFAYGYVGSVILLIFNLLMIMKPDLFGLSQADSDSGLTSRIAFVTVGLWWAGFAQIPFYHLPKDKSQSFQVAWLKKGFGELKKVFDEMRQKALLKRFLAAFFIYDMGVMTVIYVAALFADKELKIPTDGLIITILLIQLVAIPGSFLASFLSRKFGNTIALRIEIAIWATVPLAAYFTTTAEQFYVIAAVVGLVMGGIQSLSRSTYAKLIPDDTKDTASYFSFYDVCERLATALGTFFFGFIIQQTGSMRNSVLLILVLFIAGFLLLTRIPSKQVYKG